MPLAEGVTLTPVPHHSSAAAPSHLPPQNLFNPSGTPTVSFRAPRAVKPSNPNLLKPASDVKSEITRVARLYGVPVPIALAVARADSNYNQESVGGNGQGIYHGANGSLAYDPSKWRENIRGGISNLRQQYLSYGNWRLAVGAYNSPASPADQQQSRFYVDVLKALGAPITTANLTALTAWQRAEGGTASFNPFNTTQGAPGSTDYNSVGVKNYPSYQAGVKATISTLRNGNYGGILSALAAGSNPLSVASAVGSSPWGTNGGLMTSIIRGGVTLPVNPQNPYIHTVHGYASEIAGGKYHFPVGNTGVVMVSAPLPGNPVITSGYGLRKDPFGGASSDFHYGIDLSAPQGTPIHAMVGGKVIYSQYNSGSGNTVIIKDKQGREWNYFHMVTHPSVQAGQTVKPGDQIGNVGSTGESTGPHLDIHLKVNGEWVNPTAAVTRAFKVGWDKTGRASFVTTDYNSPGTGGPSASTGSVYPTGNGAFSDVLNGGGAPGRPDFSDVARQPGSPSLPQEKGKAAWQQVLDSGASSPETKRLAQRAGAVAPPSLSQQYGGGSAAY